MSVFFREFDIRIKTWNLPMISFAMGRDVVFDRKNKLVSNRFRMA